MDSAIEANSGRQAPSTPIAATDSPRARIARYDQYFNQKTFQKDFRKTGRPDTLQKRLSKKNRRHVLVVKRLIDSRGQYDGTVIEIMSDALCKVLSEINREVKGLSLTKRQPVADPELFFHSRVGLQARLAEEKLKESPDGELIDDLGTALQFIAEDHGGTIADFEKLTSHEQITFELLWALFPPSTLVYHHHHLTEQPLILLTRSLSYGRDPQGNRYANITCEIINNDGKAFGLAQDDLRVYSFPGACNIQDLSVYPLDYHKDKAALCEHAIYRGKKFAEIIRHCYETSGPAVSGDSSAVSGGDLVKFNTYGRVMIDPVAFRLFKPNSRLNPPVSHQLEKDSLKDKDYLICTPIVLGFCFGTKTWGGFAIDRLREIIWSDEAFDQLVLGTKQKRLIRALISQHSTRATRFDDIVVGKGKGLIGLLYGNPGCGKTLTAEAMAEVVHRPLYVVSAGELGTEPGHADRQLARILELAQLWNTVLLLDEADVFLQERNTTDVARNALVSIFLRQLEYYQGILILTTNMVAKFDPAFESRIHFCIKYPDLDFESRKAVWKLFISKASKSVESISEHDLNRLAEHKMNGRQIKNAVSTAYLMALDDDPKSRFSISHIDTVLEVLDDWHMAKAPGTSLIWQGNPSRHFIYYSVLFILLVYILRV